MAIKKEKIVISLGGSLIVPDKVDVPFLKEFKQFILRHTRTKQFYIITGGGKVAREYAAAAGEIGNISHEDRDWLGIHCTRLNAHLLRTIFRKHAFPRIIKNPFEKIKTNKQIIMAAGYKPGCSSDLDAVIIAKTIGAKTVLNLTNIDYVYDKDPRKYKDAKPLKQVSWKKFRSIIPKTWRYGMNAPFDPVASREAQKLGLKVIIINGKKLKEIDNFLRNKEFIGTTIEG
ncbi:MAG: UMP kinase [Candidatus Woesearchaeota archaeon]